MVGYHEELRLRRQLTGAQLTLKRESAGIEQDTSANGVGPEVSPDGAQAVKVSRESGLPQETNALFTNVEGDLDEVLKVAGEAAKKLAEQGYRTSLVLHMDIRPGFTGQLTEKPKIVDAILSGKSE